MPRTNLAGVTAACKCMAWRAANEGHQQSLYDCCLSTMIARLTSTDHRKCLISAIVMFVQKETS